MGSSLGRIIVGRRRRSVREFLSCFLPDCLFVPGTQSHGLRSVTSWLCAPLVSALVPAYLRSLVCLPRQLTPRMVTISIYPFRANRLCCLVTSHDVRSPPFQFSFRALISFASAAPALRFISIVYYRVFLPLRDSQLHSRGIGRSIAFFLLLLKTAVF